MLTEATRTETAAQQLVEALDRLAEGGTHEAVADVLTDANAYGGMTGADNPVTAWLEQQVPATAGRWGVQPDRGWVDDVQLHFAGTYTPTPGPVADFFEMYWDGGHAHLFRGVRRPLAVAA